MVNEDQKAAIADRLRDILREVKPIVLAAMILMPIFLIGAVSFLAFLKTNTTIIYSLVFIVCGFYIGSMHIYTRCAGCGLYSPISRALTSGYHCAWN